MNTGRRTSSPLAAIQKAAWVKACRLFASTNPLLLIDTPATFLTETGNSIKFTEAGGRVRAAAPPARPNYGQVEMPRLLD